MILIKKSSLVSEEFLPAGAIYGRDHAQSLKNESRGAAQNFVASSSAAALFESDSSGDSKTPNLLKEVNSHLDVDVLDSRTAGPAPRIEEEPVYEESQQYAPIKMGAHSESLLGKQEQQQPAAEIVEEEQKEPLVQAVPCLSVSSSDSIFSISKQNTTAAYTEDTTVIGEIFDRSLFAKINDVDYIKETEQQLEDMKLHI